MSPPPPSPRVCAECGGELLARGVGCPGCLLQLGLFEGEAGVVAPVAPPAEAGGSAEPFGGRRLGRYELLAEIGRGGMGVVYRARQPGLGREVAVKVLASGPFAARGFVERLRTEAAVLGRLHHPGVVTVHEVGVADGQPFLVMELVPGGSLADRVAERPLPPAAAAELMFQVALAIEHAHAAGVWHRDLKPGNILLDAEGRPRVTDFGLAKLAETDSGLTLSGQALGTPGYLAPEQVDSSLHAPGPWTDVYALGAVLYHLLTGRPVFRAANVRETFHQTLTSEPASPRALNPGVPADLEVICLKCLAKEPARRYPTAAALAEDLQRHLAGRPILARPLGVPARLVRWGRRNPLLAAVSAALLAGAVASLLTVSWLWRRAATQTEIATRTLAHLQRERVTDLFEADRVRPALRQLGELLRNDPSDRLAAARAVSALTWRNHPLPEHRFVGHTAAVVMLDVTADGTVAVSGSRDGTARIWRLDEPALAAVVLTNSAPLTVARLSPDGRQVLTAGDDGSARLWDRQRGTLARTFRHGGKISAAGFSPTGRHLLTAGDDGAVRVWSATGEGEPIVCRLAEAVFVARFDPAGERLVAGSRDSSAQIFDARTGRPLGPRLLHEQRVVDAAFSPDGRQVATASWDGRVKLWEAATGNLLAAPPGSSSWVITLAFSPAGDRLLYGGALASAHLWRPREKPAAVESWRHDQAVIATAFSPDGERLLSVGQDGQVQVRDATGKNLLTLPLMHAHPLTAAVFADEGRRVLSADDRGGLTLWDIRPGTPSPVRLEHPQATHAEWSADGSRLLTAGDDRVACVWAVATGQPVLVTRPLAANFVSATLSPEGGHLLVTARDGGNFLWDVRQGEGRELLPRHRRGMWHGRFSPDSRLAATISWDGDARVWTVATGEEAIPPLAHGAPLASVAFDPASRRLATGDRRGGVRLWDLANGTPAGPPWAHQDEVLSVAFSPDGRHVLTASLDRTVRLWAADTGQCQLILRHDSGVDRAAFSPDGRRIATSARDRTVRLWDVSSGAPVSPPLLHGGNVVAFDFDPTGRRLATATDGLVRVWDSATGYSLGEPRRHDGQVTAVRFSPDGRQLLSCSDDGTILLWPAGELPLPVPGWFPGLLEWLTDHGSTGTSRDQLLAAVRRGDPRDPWTAWGQGFLGDRHPTPATASPAVPPGRD